MGCTNRPMFDQHIAFLHCTVAIDREGRYVETVFADGAKVSAMPHDTPEYRQHARELGYGDDTAAMSREHEVCHSLIAEARGEDVSPTLFAVAHNEPANTLHYFEERLVLDFQRYLNGGPLTPGLVAEFDGITLKDEAKRLLRR